MRHRERIDKEAIRNASDLFLEHKVTNAVLHTSEAIQALAKEQAALFAEAHPKFTPRQEVEHAYQNSFATAYTQHLEAHGTTSFKEDTLRDLGREPH